MEIEIKAFIEWIGMEGYNFNRISKKWYKVSEMIFYDIEELHFLYHLNQEPPHKN